MMLNIADRLNGRKRFLLVMGGQCKGEILRATVVVETIQLTIDPGGSIRRKSRFHRAVDAISVSRGPPILWLERRA